MLFIWKESSRAYDFCRSYWDSEVDVVDFEREFFKVNAYGENMIKEVPDICSSRDNCFQKQLGMRFEHETYLVVTEKIYVNQLVCILQIKKKKGTTAVMTKATQ